MSGMSTGKVPDRPWEHPVKPSLESPSLPSKLSTTRDERSRGAGPALPQNQPWLHGSCGNGVIPAEAKGHREEERGEGGDATNREMLASALWLLIQLKGLIPRDAPVGKAASKRSPVERHGH